VSQLASSMTQLRHLSISRYNISSTACLSTATQLSALSLQVRHTPHRPPKALLHSAIPALSLSISVMWWKGRARM